MAQTAPIYIYQIDQAFFLVFASNAENMGSPEYKPTLVA